MENPSKTSFFIANLASDRTADRRVNDVISMLSLHNQAELEMCPWDTDAPAIAKFGWKGNCH